MVRYFELLAVVRAPMADKPVEFRRPMPARALLVAGCFEDVRCEDHPAEVTLVHGCVEYVLVNLLQLAQRELRGHELEDDS